MAGENHFQEAMAAHHEMVDTDEQPWKSVSSSSATALESINDCFECNICLDHAQDPVVTLCGHLYCWPCMYKWLHFQSASSTPEQSPQCPVCKAEVSQATLVPLYGRGNSLPQSAEEKKGPFPGLEIPCRPPPAPGVHALVTTSSTSANTPSREVQHNFQSNQHHQQYYSDFYRSDDMGSSPMFTVSGSSTNAHPMIGMFGEMVYARMFGNAAEIGLFGHPNSYYLMSSSNPRVRRQEMKAEKSLNRISIFLFCCVVLCLLSF